MSRRNRSNEASHSFKLLQGKVREKWDARAHVCSPHLHVRWPDLQLSVFHRRSPHGEHNLLWPGCSSRWTPSSAKTQNRWEQERFSQTLHTLQPFGHLHYITLLTHNKRATKRQSFSSRHNFEFLEIIFLKWSATEKKIHYNIESNHPLLLSAHIVKIAHWPCFWHICTL